MQNGKLKLFSYREVNNDMPEKYDHFYSYSQVYQPKSHQQLTEKIGVSKCREFTLH